MSNQNNGGPAFPWGGDLNDCPTINLGMALRDYFAIHADGFHENCTPSFASEISGVMHPIIGASKKEWSAFWAEAEASFRYMRADAMLKERDK